MNVARVAIVGAGAVGATTAYSLLISGTAPEIVLINRSREFAEGQMHDLKDAALFAHSTRVAVGDFADCQSADVVIITAGVHQTPGMRSRLDDLDESAAILREIVLEIGRFNPLGVLLIASNPVDILTYAAWKWSGLPANRVIGAGTLLDTSRFRRRLGERYDVATENVHAYIIGEHGDSQVPLLSSAQIAGVHFREADLQSLARETRFAGLEIQHAKGATYYGIASALTHITRSILRDENAALTVSSLAPESMGLGTVCLSLPSIINRNGVARVLPISLNDTERQGLEASAQILKQHLALLDFQEQAAA